MALQSSASAADPLKFSEVKTEFDLGDNLRSYLGAASGVPSTGTLKLTDFLGTSAIGVWTTGGTLNTARYVLAGAGTQSAGLCMVAIAINFGRCVSRSITVF